MHTIQQHKINLKQLRKGKHRKNKDRRKILTYPLSRLKKVRHKMKLFLVHCLSHNCVSYVNETCELKLNASNLSESQSPSLYFHFFPLQTQLLYFPTHHFIQQILFSMFHVPSLGFGTAHAYMNKANPYSYRK